MNTFLDQLRLVGARVARIQDEAGEPEAGSALASALLELQLVTEELQVAGEELQAQREQLIELAGLRPKVADVAEQLFERLPVPLLETDACGVVLRAGRGACDLLGRSRAVLEGAPLTALVPPGEPRQRLDELRRGLAGGREHGDVVLPVAGPAGEQLCLRFTGGPGVGTDAAVVRWVLSVVPSVGGARPAGAAGADPWLTLQATLADWSSHLLDEPLDETLVRIADGGARVARADWSSACVLTGRGRPVSAAGSPQAGTFEAAQREAREGPALEALRTGARVRSGDVPADPRWPGFSELVRQSPPCSVLAEPLRVDDQLVGVLTLYAGTTDAFDEVVPLVEVFARSAAVLAVNARCAVNQRGLVRQMSEAMTTRAVIEQAKGIVIAESGCADLEAFERLRAGSMRSNVKLRDLAVRMVENAREEAARRRSGRG